MQINDCVLRNDEMIAYRLRELYQQFGYSRFRMNKFEEYELYVRNKDFLISDSVITFTGANGRLLALKPDVTLSIIKNCRDDGSVQKVYYNENVYRLTPNTHDFQEILQIGVECIGNIDEYCVCETVLLALKSLQRTGTEYRIDLAHLGVAYAIAEECGLDEEQCKQAFSLIGQKNVHELTAFCNKNGLESKKLCALATMGNELLQNELAKLKALCDGAKSFEAFSEFEQTVQTLRSMVRDSDMTLDFSIVKDMPYYSGVVFKGYLRGVPEPVLSGGRYDKLMRRLGKKSGGVGFAVYLDALKRLKEESAEFDTDILLLYSENDDPASVFRKAAELTELGSTVLALQSIPEGLRYQSLIRYNGA